MIAGTIAGKYLPDAWYASAAAVAKSGYDWLPDFNTEMILAAFDRLKETRENEREKWIREVGPYFYPCPRKEWLGFPIRHTPIEACVDAIAFGTGIYYETKENSNMSTNTNTPAVEYSKNCAIKTLQQQLERAEELNITANYNRECWQREVDKATATLKTRTEEAAATEKNVKELKAALKKLGGEPAVKISK